jgi:hypothetical protein
LLETTLVICTLLGGVSAVWFFVDKLRAIEWRRPTFLNVSDVHEDTQVPANAVIAPGWRTDSEPVYPSSLVRQVQAEFPSYRLPQFEDISGDWEVFGNPESLSPFYASGDFFGDGREDHAVFLLDQTTDFYKLVVFPRNEEKKPISLFNEIGDPQRFFVRTVPPGRYRTMHDKSYASADPSEQKILNLRHDAINTGRFESADWIYHWNEDSQEFQKNWMSD